MHEGAVSSSSLFSTTEPFTSFLQRQAKAAGYTGRGGSSNDWNGNLLTTKDSGLGDGSQTLFRSGFRHHRSCDCIVNETMWRYSSTDVWQDNAATGGPWNSKETSNEVNIGRHLLSLWKERAHHSKLSSGLTGKTNRRLRGWANFEQSENAEMATTTSHRWAKQFHDCYSSEASGEKLWRAATERADNERLKKTLERLQSSQSDQMSKALNEVEELCMKLKMLSLKSSSCWQHWKVVNAIIQGS